MTECKKTGNNICWSKVEILVFQRQQKIYQASFSGNTIKIYYLQSKTIQSTVRKLIAIRRTMNDPKKHLSYYPIFFLINNVKISQKKFSIKKVIFSIKTVEKSLIILLIRSSLLIKEVFLDW